jgi:ribosomal protein L37AE/L43A
MGIKEYLEEHGYQRGGCKFCGRWMWTNTGIWECDSCNPSGREIGETKDSIGEELKDTKD